MNVSNEAVEAACEAFYNDPSGLTSWERATRVSPDMAARYRASMARALEAAAPHLMASDGDEAVEAVAKKAFQKAEGIKWDATTEHTRNKWRERYRHQVEAMAKTARKKATK